MMEFSISSKGLEKWMHQNRAEYTGAFVEGTLLDNFVIACKRGFAAVYESSDYRVEYETGAAQKVWSRWYQFEAVANTGSG